MLFVKQVHQKIAIRQVPAIALSLVKKRLSNDKIIINS